MITDPPVAHKPRITLRPSSSLCFSRAREGSVCAFFWVGWALLVGVEEVALHGRHEADLCREGARDAATVEVEVALHGRHEANLRREGAFEPVIIQSQRIHTSKTIAPHTIPGAVGVI